MRIYKFEIKKNGVLLEIFYHENEDIEIIQQDTVFNINERTSIFGFLKKISNLMNTWGMTSFEIRKL